MKACKPAWIVDLQAFLVAGAEGLESTEILYYKIIH